MGSISMRSGARWGDRAGFLAELRQSGAPSASFAHADSVAYRSNCLEVTLKFPRLMLTRLGTFGQRNTEKQGRKDPEESVRRNLLSRREFLVDGAA